MAKEINLSKGAVAIVDDADYESLSRWKWYLNNRYAARDIKAGGKRRIYMHRWILGITGPKEVDHINGNQLDNRRSNLRACERSENQCNIGKPRHGKISKYKGVTRMPNGTIKAQIQFRKKNYHLGLFGTEEEAARAYNNKATEFFGRFARLNEGV